MEMTRNAADGCMELTITGRLDGYWADHLDAGLTETVREGHHRLRLNLSDVTFISSAGIAVLVKFYKRLTAIKGGLVITGTSQSVRTVLDITRLWGVQTFEADHVTRKARLASPGSAHHDECTGDERDRRQPSHSDPTSATSVRRHP